MFNVSHRSCSFINRPPITLNFQFIHHFHNNAMSNSFFGSRSLIRFGREQTPSIERPQKVGEATSDDSHFPFVPLSRNFRNKINRSNKIGTRIEPTMHEHFLIGQSFWFFCSHPDDKWNLNEFLVGVRGLKTHFYVIEKET